MLQKRSACYDGNDYRVVVFGDAAVGKTALIQRFIKSTFCDHYSPTIEDTYRQVITCDNSVCSLHITDTGGSHSFPAMNRLAIHKGQAFVLVFSLTDKSSYEKLASFHREIKSVKEASLDQIPVMLVGNKCDTYDRQVSNADAVKLAGQWKCTYIETSAARNHNAREVFEQLLVQEKRLSITLGANTEQRKSKSGAGIADSVRQKCVIM